MSHGPFNPAVAVGITVLGLAAPASPWSYVLGNLAGAASAALVFNALDLGNDKATTATPAEQAGLDLTARPAT